MKQIWNNKHKKPEKILVILACLLAAIYLLNCFTPLRLTHDSIRYLLLEEWMERGFPLGTWVDKDFLPYGYSAILFILSKLQLFHSFFIALTNLLYLTASLWFINRIFGWFLNAWLWLVFVLLSWLTIKLTITPLSEMQYLFLSSGSIYFYQTYRADRRPWFLIWAILFFAAAMVTRTVAITLFIALIASLVHENRRNWSIGRLRTKFIFAGLLTAFVSILYFSRPLRINDYLRYFSYRLLGNGPSAFFLNMERHLTLDWPDVFVNTPISKITFIPVSLLGLLFFALGSILLGWILFILIAGKMKAPVFVRYYLLVYILVIFNWPYHESRFWLPILPMLFAGMFQTPIPANRLVRALVFAGKCGYIAAGIFAMSYYTYTSFNKRALATKQDAGDWQKEYETHFFGKPVKDSVSTPNQLVVQLLKKID
jgi:hypothetical protein